MSLLNPQNNTSIYNLLCDYRRQSWREPIKNFFFDHFVWCPDKTLPQLVLASEESVQQWLTSHELHLNKPFYLASKNIVIDDQVIEVKTYSLQTFDNKHLGIGFAIYENIVEKMNSLETFADKLMWLCKNKLVSKESLVFNIKHLTVLERQQLHCFSKVKQHKPWFSAFTHYFENYVNVMHNLKGILMLGSNEHESRLVCKNGFLLPLKSEVYFNINCTSLINVGTSGGRNRNNLPVVQQYFVTWRSSDYKDGVALTPANPDDNVYDLNDEVGSSSGLDLFKELINYGSLKEFKGCVQDLDDLSLSFLQGEWEDISKGLSHNNAKLIGSINLIENEENGYTIAPIINKDKDTLSMKMFFEEAWGGALYFVPPKSCSTANITEMIKEFLHYADIDVELISGGVSGGGYSYRKIQIGSFEEKFYQEDIEAGTIILGDKRA